MKKLIRIQLIALLLLIGNVWTIHAQSKLLKGIVMDSQSKMGIEGVVISTSDGKTYTLTNEEGDFEFTIGDQVESVWFNQMNYQIKEMSTKAAMLVELDLINKELEEVVVYTKPMHEVFGAALQKAIHVVDKGDLYKTYVRTFALVNKDLNNVADGLIDYYVKKNNKRPYVELKQNRAFTSKKDLDPESDLDQLLSVMEHSDFRDLITNNTALKNIEKLLKSEKDYVFSVKKRQGVQGEENLVVEFSPKEELNDWLCYEGYLVFTADQKQLMAYQYGLSNKDGKSRKAVPLMFGKMYFNDVEYRAMYNTHQGAYQLSYLFLSLDYDFESKIFGNNRVMNLSEVVVDEVIKGVDIPKDKKMKEGQLFNSRSNYQTEFWKNRNIRLLSNREAAILRELEERSQP